MIPIVFLFAFCAISFIIRDFIFNDRLDNLIRTAKFSILLGISTTGVLKKAHRLKRREWKYLYKGRISEYVEEYVDELIEFCSFVSRNKDPLHIVSDEIESICQEADQIYQNLREYVVNPDVRRSLTRVINNHDYTESDHRAYNMMKAVLENATDKTNNLKLQAKEILDKALEDESVEIDRIVDNWENGISIVESNSDSSVSEKEDLGGTDLSNNDNKTDGSQPKSEQNDLSNVFNEFSNPLWDEKDTDDDEDSDQLISFSSVA